MASTSVLPLSVLGISWLSCVLLHNTPFLTSFWYAATAQSTVCSSFTSHFPVPILISALTTHFSQREKWEREKELKEVLGDGRFGKETNFFFAESAHSYDFLWFLSFLYPLIFSKKIPTVCCCFFFHYHKEWEEMKARESWKKVLGLEWWERMIGFEIKFFSSPLRPMFSLTSPPFLFFTVWVTILFCGNIGLSFVFHFCLCTYLCKSDRISLCWFLEFRLFHR